MEPYSSTCKSPSSRLTVHNVQSIPESVRPHQGSHSTVTIFCHLLEKWLCVHHNSSYEQSRIFIRNRERRGFYKMLPIEENSDNLGVVARWTVAVQNRNLQLGIVSLYVCLPRWIRSLMPASVYSVLGVSKQIDSWCVETDRFLVRGNWSVLGARKLVGAWKLIGPWCVEHLNVTSHECYGNSRTCCCWR
jgi:hypothetical protein